MNKINNLAALLFLVTPLSAWPQDELAEQAQTLTHRTLLVDTHIDVPYRLQEHWEDVTKATEKGNFDYPRAMAGGLNLPFMSIYIPASYAASGGAKALADGLIDRVEAIVARAPKKFGIATSIADATRLFDEGKIALAMGMENGSGIEDDLGNLKHFYNRGIRYITLAHSRSNLISDSSYDKTHVWNGLSPFGKKVITEMNRLGIMVDISHVSDQAFYEALGTSAVPCIASHTSARHFTPGWERNADDAMIQALAAKGGVLMINFGSSFLRADAQKDNERYGKARDHYMEVTGIEDQNDPRMDAFKKSYREKFPAIFADVKDVANHIDYVAKLVGVEHVGIGSDFDGVGDSLPSGLKDVSMYPNLVRVLLARDYSESAIEKILGGNLMRVWQAVEDYAARQD